MSVTDEEMDRRIKDLAARQGIGSAVTVKRIAPEPAAAAPAAKPERIGIDNRGKPKERISPERAREMILELLSGGEAKRAVELAQATKRSEPQTRELLREMEAKGEVAKRGVGVDATKGGRPAALWVRVDVEPALDQQEAAAAEERRRAEEELAWSQRENTEDEEVDVPTTPDEQGQVIRMPLATPTILSREALAMRYLAALVEAVETNGPDEKLCGRIERLLEVA